MKKYILFTLIAFSFCLSGKAQNELYKKYSEKKGINTTIISESMFKNNLKNMIDDKSVTKVADDLNFICILETSDTKLINDLSKDVEKYVKKYKLDVLIQQVKNGKKTMFYSGKKDKKSEIVLIKSGGESYKVIIINGNISFDELKGIDSNATSWLIK